MGYLDVVVPPDILDDETSGDVMVPEGGSVTLNCKARGYPEPDITWKREDRGEIVFRDQAIRRGMTTTSYQLMNKHESFKY